MRQLFKIVAVILALGGLWYFLADRPLHPTAKVFRLPPGTSMHAFAYMLKRRHVIDFADPFIILARIEGDSSGLKAGDYRFADPTTPFNVLRKVVSGQVVEYPLLLVPGWTFQQIRQALAKAPHLRDNIRTSSHPQIRKLLHITNSLQGNFFPDTYFYTAGTSATAVLRRAHRRLKKLLLSEWLQRAPHLPLKTPEQALILASLVERETAMAGERRKIAGVFVNRLRLGMRLETDPTVIFGLGAHYHGLLTTSDLAFPSPYNTYLHYGLPPTPIGLASQRTLYATLHPDKTQALYFVATGHGGHVFSDSLKAQDRAIRKYELDQHPK